jgi:hypothetical protein
MAGGIFNLAKLFGMTIRESANDGSDFTNPDADYRRLFLGEDGQLHVKDSAGTVTAIGSGTASTASVNQLSGDVTMTTGGTFYDGPSLTLAAGTYVLIGTVTVDGNNLSAATQNVAQLWDGTTVAGSTEGIAYAGATNRDICSLTVVGLVVIASGTPTWKISATANANGSILRAATPDSGSGNNASTLVALKIA